MKARKAFFFEKKKQKTFIGCRGLLVGRISYPPHGRGLLVGRAPPFFKKEGLSSFLAGLLPAKLAV
jgi:hypothetical protein